MKLEKRIKYIKTMQPKRQKEIISSHDGISFITTKQLESALIAYRKYLNKDKNVNKINNSYMTKKLILEKYNKVER